MAIVFRARDLRLDRLVAIKVLRPELSANLGRDRFDREIEIAGSLQHPNILPLYESGDADGCLYYVMPFVSGQTLGDLLKAEGQLPVERAVAIACEVADALAYAHEVGGVVHRDIKPGNILLSSGHAMVSDFGVARAVQAAGGPQLTVAGMALGTPAYMSPEQAGGEDDLDGRSDIYSLGCVLYEMLAGDPPFMASTPKALIARQIMEPPPSLEVVRPNVPSHLALALRKALAKVPADRFESASQFKSALAGNLAFTPLPEPAPDHEGAGPGQRPNRWGLRVLVTGSVALAALAALYWFVLRSPALDLSADRVVVFPLVESGFQEAGAGLNVALAIENALVYARPLELASGTDWFVPEAEGVARPTELEARRITADLGARYMIGGAVVRRDDSVSVRLDLYELAGQSTLRERASGLASDLGRVGIAAAVNLLPSILDPDRASLVDLSPLLDRSPESIALWIQGEREYRRSQFGTALDLYERALAADSLLAFAAVKGALAASWEHDTEAVLRLVPAGVEHEELLPRTYAYFARGVEAYQLGLSRTAIEWLERAREEDPYWNEPWAIEGEVYFHLLPSAVPLDSLAEWYFEQAIRRDSSSTEPLFHLTELAARRGDVVRARALQAQLGRVDPEALYRDELELMVVCLTDGPDEVDWIVEDAVEPGGELPAPADDDSPLDVNVAPAFNAGVMFATGAWQVPCAEAALRAVLARGSGSAGYELNSVFLLQGLSVARGRPDEALALLDSAHSAGMRAAEIAWFLDALAGVDVGDRDDGANAGLRAKYGDRYESLTRVRLLGLLGVWNRYHGNPQIVPDLEARLSELGRGDESEDGAPGDSTAALLARSLSGHRWLAEGDTIAAIAAFESLIPSTDRTRLGYAYAETVPLDRLLLAELRLAQGDPEGAWRAASVFDHPEPIHFVPFVRRSLEVRLAAARAMGRDDLEAKLGPRLRALGIAGS